MLHDKTDKRFAYEVSVFEFGSSAAGCLEQESQHKFYT